MGSDSVGVALMAIGRCLHVSPSERGQPMDGDSMGVM